MKNNHYWIKWRSFISESSDVFKDTLRQIPNKKRESSNKTVLPRERETFITFKDAESMFRYFHLSAKKLGDDAFTFSAQIPRYPAQWEDDFTERVSLAPKIEDAVKAGAKGPYVYAGDLKNTKKDDIPIVDVEKTWDNCPYKKYGNNSAAERGNFYDDQALEWFVDEVARRGERLFYYGPSSPSTDWNDRDWMEYERENDRSGGILRQMIYGNFPLSLNKIPKDPDDYFTLQMAPSELPKDYQDAWYSCVPDAKITHEKWSPQDTTLMYLGRLVMQGYNHIGEIVITSHARQYLEKNGIDFSNLES